MRLFVKFSFPILAITAILLGGCVTQGTNLNNTLGGPSHDQPPSIDLTKASRWTPPVSTQYVQCSRLNFRECPSSSCRILSVLNRGQLVNAVEGRQGWVKVTVRGIGRDGWVAARYLGNNRPPYQARTSNVEQKAAPEPPPPEEDFATPQQEQNKPTSVTEEFAN